MIKNVECVLNTIKVLILTENIAELVDTLNADEYVSSFFIKRWYFWRWILFHLGFYIDDCDATDYWFIFIVFGCLIGGFFFFKFIIYYILAEFENYIEEKVKKASNNEDSSENKNESVMNHGKISTNVEKKDPHSFFQFKKALKKKKKN